MLVVYRLEVDSIMGLGSDSEPAVKIDSLLDEERLKIVRRMNSNSSGCASARGTGLLLQYAGQEIIRNSLTEIDCIKPVCLNIDDILKAIDKRIDFKYCHGQEGKPYWEDKGMPYFNVSHSAGLILLAVSDTEIGIDVQKIRGKNEVSMANRFFSEREARMVSEETDDRHELFYRLWARKEALGKRTGLGVRPYLDTDVSDLESSFLKQYIWDEIREDDFFICICR